MGCGSSASTAVVSTPPARGRAPVVRHRVNSAISFYTRNPKRKTSKNGASHISGEAAENLRRILIGDTSVERHDDFKIVRIFTSSTFTGVIPADRHLTEWLLMSVEKVVDMRWGLREDAEDNHMTTELCLKELAACQRLSTGPNFVTLLSHKYGYRPFPRVIEATEFETITKDLQTEEQEMIELWFRRDDNAVPPAYILQPISSILLDFNSTDKEAKDVARKQWWAVFELLQTILKEGAQKYLDDPARRRIYAMSVTEAEIQNGVLNASEPSKHCLWFNRRISQFDNDQSPPSNSVVARYYDGHVEDARSLLKTLREENLSSRLPDSNIISYEVQWDEKCGVDSNVPDHAAYINQLCQDFESHVQSMFQEGLQTREQQEVSNPLYNEVVQHLNFCQAKCSKFHGREKTLENIKTYMKGKSRTPLIVHGKSGSGKTSILAMAAWSAPAWMASKAVVICRFIGTTQSSSSLRPLLASINEQILQVYMGDRDLRQDLKYLIADFQELMALATASKPLVILLDSLDQLDNLDGGRHLHWLPRQLPPNVRIILTTLPEEKYGCFPRLEALYPDKKCFLDVPVMGESDVQGLLDKWLEHDSRRLTSEQLDSVINAYNGAPLPLYLKLVYDEALRWHSYDPPDVTRLEATITDSINALFGRLEQVHGATFVSHALGCITASQGGLTESELEDIMSLTDPVLNDVYEWWTPPVRRLPPLLFVRLRNELEQYLVNRGVDGVLVTYWYHRQFIETAETRYLGNEIRIFNIHMAIAEFFLGVWAATPKQYTNMSGEKQSALRYVANQPLEFQEGEYNLRKLMQLPYHLMAAGEIGLLKSQVLCNYEFLLTKLKAVSFSSVLQDMKSAALLFPDDQEIHVVRETLQLARDGLNANPSELAGQLLGRIHGTGSQPLLTAAKEMLSSGDLPPEAVNMLSLLEAFEEKHRQKNQHITTLLEEAREASSPVLVPDRGFLTPPGGQLLHKLAEHYDVCNDVDITADGSMVVTGSYDNTTKVWDIQSGQMLQSVTFPENVSHVRFCNGNKWLAVSCWYKLLYIVDTDLGAIIHSMQGGKGNDVLDMALPITICNVMKEEHMVAMRNQNIEIWNIELGTRRRIIKHDINDWSVHHGGQNIDKRHFASIGEYFVLAGFRGHAYHVYSVFSDTYKQTVDVFPSYAYDPHSPTADFATSSEHHISALALTPDGTLVVLCDGATQEIHLYHFEQGIPVRVIPNQCGSGKIKNFYFPPGADWFYFTNKTVIGSINLRELSSKTILTHPCVVTKVVAVGNKFLTTIGEDSILRIWDRTMEPFQQDLSLITGKVAVSSQEVADQSKETFSSMFRDIVGEEADDLDALMTTEEITNYWSTESANPDEQEVHVLTHFKDFRNKYYTATIQSNAKTNCTICFSIWETEKSTCVRRMFFPKDQVQVYCLINDDSVLYAECGKLKLLCCHMWKVLQVFEGTVDTEAKLHVIPSPRRREVFVESAIGSFMRIYDIDAGQVIGHLVPSNKTIKEFMSMPPDLLPHLEKIQMSADGLIAAALYSPALIAVWDVNTRKLLHTIEPHRHLGGRKENAHFDIKLTASGGHIVMSRDEPTSLWENPQIKDASHAVFDIKNGSILSLQDRDDEQCRATEMVPILRNYKRKLLQLFGIDAEKNLCYLLDQVDIGSHARSMKIEGERVVTWCADPKEKTLRYFAIDQDKLTFLGSFTLDSEVSDVHLMDDGRTLFVNSCGGIIKLELIGGTLPEVPKKRPVKMFQGVKLDIKFERDQEEYAKVDGTV